MVEQDKAMPCIVALDGPCASGKGTVAWGVAQAYGLAHVDTGAIYRVLAHAALQKGIEPGNDAALAQLARSLTIRMQPQPARMCIWANGRDVTQLIRTDTVGQLASRIAAAPAVRKALLALQRQPALAHPKGAVVEGRDIGTTVFPDAAVKIFLTAPESKRAQRRYEQLLQLGQQLSYEKVLRELRERDQRDSSRAAAPLQQADGAEIIDCTTLTAQQVVHRICQLLRSHLPSDVAIPFCHPDKRSEKGSPRFAQNAKADQNLGDASSTCTEAKGLSKQRAQSPLGGPRGMPDCFGEALTLHQHITASALSTCASYGYQQIQTPLVEQLALFERSVGENTDVVQKEMYVLQNTDPPLCLRPENTAGVVRAAIQHGLLHQTAELKLCYFGPMFRHERPQKGRLRQFHQVGAEAFGSSEPSLDAEVIVLVHQWLSSLGLPNLQIRVNSLGTPHERRCYGSTLAKHLQQHAETLCKDCQRRMRTNPLRVLDCKTPPCMYLAQGLPSSLDMLTPDSRTRFETVVQLLQQADIAVHIDKGLVRGLDYYTHTVFEVVCQQQLGAQNAVAGGGRYDELVHNLGGPPTPAAGFAAGVERLALALGGGTLPSPPPLATKACGGIPPSPEAADVTNKKGASSPVLVLIHADTVGRELAQRLARQLRQRQQRVELLHTPRSVKAQLRHANRLGADWALVLGESEVQAGTALLKQLHTSQQQTTLLDPQEILTHIQGEHIL